MRSSSSSSQASKVALEAKCREQAQLNQLTVEHATTAKAAEVSNKSEAANLEITFVCTCLLLLLISILSNKHEAPSLLVWMEVERRWSGGWG